MNSSDIKFVQELRKEHEVIQDTLAIFKSRPKCFNKGCMQNTCKLNDIRSEKKFISKLTISLLRKI